MLIMMININSIRIDFQFRQFDGFGIFHDDTLQWDRHSFNIRLDNETNNGFDFHFVNKDIVQSPNNAAVMYPKFFVFLFLLIIHYK